MQKFYEFILQHYASRIAEEKRPEALAFLRKTYHELKSNTHEYDYYPHVPYRLLPCSSNIFNR